MSEAKHNTEFGTIDYDGLPWAITRNDKVFLHLTQGTVKNCANLPLALELLNSVGQLRADREALFIALKKVQKYWRVSTGLELKSCIDEAISLFESH